MAKETTDYKEILFKLETQASKLVCDNNLFNDYIDWLMETRTPYSDHVIIDFIVAKGSEKK